MSEPTSDSALRAEYRALAEELTQLLAGAKETYPQLKLAAVVWIPVSELLPQEGLGVLVASEEDWIGAQRGYYSTKYQTWHEATTYEQIDGVTHWALLPTHPKKL